MTASELFEVLGPVMGKGILPEWLAYSAEFREWYQDGANSGVLSDAAACRIAIGAMVKWRASLGYSSVPILMADGQYFDPKTNKHYPSMTAALVAACLAALEETK